MEKLAGGEDINGSPELHPLTSKRSKVRPRTRRLSPGSREDMIKFFTFSSSEFA